ncbi:MAG TPA: acyltransferase [Acidimicrobiia bacterium]
MSEPGRRLDALTPLRAIAAFAVFLYHFQWVLDPSAVKGTWSWYRFGFSQGFLGVSFFFVLSGFVLTWSGTERALDTKRDFYVRRFARVWPNHGAIWLAWAGLVFLGVEHTGMLAAFANLFLVQSWFVNSKIAFSMVAPSWSLSVEVFFYLCFPFLLPSAIRCGPRVRAQIAGLLGAVYIVVPVLLRHASHDVKGYPYHFPPYRMIEFVLGIFLALSLREGRFVKVPVAVASAVCAVAYCAAGLISNDFAPVVTLLPFLLLIGSVAQADLAKPQTTTRSWAVHLGVVSFAFYLTQSLVLALAHQRLFKHITKWGMAERGIVFVALLLVSLGLAQLLHEIVEKNAERFLRRELLGRPAEASQ